MFKIQLHTNHSLIIFSWELYLSLHIRVFILGDKLGYGAPTTLRLLGYLAVTEKRLEIENRGLRHSS